MNLVSTLQKQIVGKYDFLVDWVEWQIQLVQFFQPIKRQLWNSEDNWTLILDHFDK